MYNWVNIWKLMKASFHKKCVVGGSLPISSILGRLRLFLSNSPKSAKFIVADGLYFKVQALWECSSSVCMFVRLSVFCGSPQSSSGCLGHFPEQCKAISSV